MPRISAIDQLAQPALKFRYKIVWLHLPGTFVYAKGVKLPQYEQATQTISRGNYKVPVKGRISWSPVTITCYRFEAVTLVDLDRYYLDHLQVGGGNQLSAADHSAADTKDLAIVYMDTTGIIPLGTWVLKNAFISGADFGNLDWSANEVQEHTLTVHYDYATYTGV